MFILLTSNKDQKIVLYSSESIYINLLEEEPEMQELRLQLDDTHEGDCKKPGEILTTGWRIVTLLFCKRACGRESIIHMTTY